MAETVENPDHEEATEILTTFHASLFPGAHSVARSTAASSLVGELAQLLTAAGFGVTGSNVVVGPESHKISIQISSDDKGVHFDGRRLNEPFRESCDDRLLDYQPPQRRFVGKKADTFLVPKPGEPHARRSALAVASEAFIRAVHKARGTLPLTAAAE